MYLLAIPYIIYPLHSECLNASAELTCIVDLATMVPSVCQRMKSLWGGVQRAMNRGRPGDQVDIASTGSMTNVINGSIPGLRLCRLDGLKILRSSNVLAVVLAHPLGYRVSLVNIGLVFPH